MCARAMMWEVNAGQGIRTKVFVAMCYEIVSFAAYIEARECQIPAL